MSPTARPFMCYGITDVTEVQITSRFLSFESQSTDTEETLEFLNRTRFEYQFSHETNRVTILFPSSTSRNNSDSHVSDNFAKIVCIYYSRNTYGVIIM